MGRHARPSGLQRFVARIRPLPARGKRPCGQVAAAQGAEFDPEVTVPDTRVLIERQRAGLCAWTPSWEPSTETRMIPGG